MAITTKASKFSAKREPSKSAITYNSFNPAPHTIIIKDGSKEELMRRIELKKETGWAVTSEIEFILGDKDPQTANRNSRSKLTNRNSKKRVETESVYQVTMKRKTIF